MKYGNGEDVGGSSFDQDMKTSLRDSGAWEPLSRHSEMSASPLRFPATLGLDPMRGARKEDLERVRCRGGWPICPSRPNFKPS